MSNLDQRITEAYARIAAQRAAEAEEKHRYALKRKEENIVQWHHAFVSTFGQEAFNDLNPGIEYDYETNQTNGLLMYREQTFRLFYLTNTWQLIRIDDTQRDSNPAFPVPLFIDNQQANYDNLLVMIDHLYRCRPEPGRPTINDF